MPSKFLEHVNIYENSCEKLCIMRLKKFIIEIETCVDNCFSETFYKYEYKNICYSQCPVRTQLKNDSIYLCEDCPYYYSYDGTSCIDSIPEGYYLNSTSDKSIDKCPSKCGKCSLESNGYGLCISCNINSEYYPKYNDESNRDSFIQCYYKDEDHTGFYLDEENNIYKPCYEKCKKCEREGNDENNHCLECKDGHDYIYDNGNCNIKLWESSDIVNDVTVKIDNRESTVITELISSYISMISSYDNNIPTINTINIREAISDIIITESKLTDIIEKEEKKYSYDINTITEEAKKIKVKYILI